MPVRRTIRRSANSDIESVRAAIRAGVHLLPREAQRDATRHLTDHQKALLSYLCPGYETVFHYLDGYEPDPGVLRAARKELKADIERAKRM